MTQPDDTTPDGDELSEDPNAFFDEEDFDDEFDEDFEEETEEERAEAEALHEGDFTSPPPGPEEENGSSDDG